MESAHQHHHLTGDEWDAVASDPDFQSLQRAKRAFIAPATIFFVVFYFAMFVGLGWFSDAMMRPAWGSMTVGVAWALSQFAVSWILLALYLRRARAFDEAAERIVEQTRAEFAG